jgi:hypothetical protein
LGDETPVTTKKVSYVEIRSKTFWTALVGIIGTACAWYLGTIQATEAIPLIWGGLMAMFIRQTAANSGK